ncbi:hypothetical protein CALCODRAFT_193108 [Calocera cornea HHB12733]|uniref:Uncharacterized protein n=1 Tax=Calocera cornea HHB12733 TaxID=1353952 RepID=A0A165C7M7_9BASI|nr:hypothetical protein CALCODRAFT_193108 [Calocera cornea HHB12733]
MHPVPVPVLQWSGRVRPQAPDIISRDPAPNPQPDPLRLAPPVPFPATSSRVSLAQPIVPLRAANAGRPLPAVTKPLDEQRHPRTVFPLCRSLTARIPSSAEYQAAGRPAGRPAGPNSRPPFFLLPFTSVWVNLLPFGLGWALPKGFVTKHVNHVTIAFGCN